MSRTFTGKARWIAMTLALAIAATLGRVGMAGQTGTQVFQTVQGRVENVRYERVGTTFVVTYDLVSPDPTATFSVGFEASFDGGTTFNFTPAAVKGDVGDGVTPGTGKRIVWSFQSDTENQNLDQFRFRVISILGTPGQRTEEVPPIENTGGDQTRVPPPGPPASGGGGSMKWILIGGGGAAAAAAALFLGGTEPPPECPAGFSGSPPNCIPPPPPCTFSISPTSWSNAPGNGGSMPVQVTSPGGCAWSVVGHSSFVTTSVQSGTGNGSVTVSVQSNPGGQRTGSVTIASNGFSITQAEGVGCQFTFTPVSPEPSPSPTCNHSQAVWCLGGGDTVASPRHMNWTAANASCSWNTAGSAPWLRMNPSQASGLSGQIAITANGNTTGAVRHGSLRISGSDGTVREVPISQGIPGH